MKIDTEQLKQNNPIETVIGRYLDLKKDGSGFKACCPFHGEKTPSFNVNPNLKTFKCFGCGEGGDVVEFIMKYKGVDFKEACEILGAEPTPVEKHQPKPKPAAKKKPAKVVALSYPEKYESIFTLGAVTKASGNLTENFPHFKTAWKYFNEKSEVELVVVRWENDEGKKQVLTYYYDGKKIQLKGYPVLLYNRDLLATDQERDVLIVEGEKCADAVGTLNTFIGVCWNGGARKVDDVDFSILKNRVVYIWPDDDQKLYKHGPKKGEMMSPEDQPGNVMAAAVLKHLPHAQIVDLSKIVDQLREIEPDGADIVEADQFMSDAEIIEYVYANSARVESGKSETAGHNAASVSPDSNKNTSNSGSEPDPRSWPFEILGIADDGKAYFISSNDRMLETKPTSISRNFMMALVGVDWWREAYGKDKDAWEEATSDLIHISSTTDFDPERIRGRGAWCESDGRICYHDGGKTVGEYSKDRIYLRRARKDIGITGKQATAKQRKKLFNIAEQLSFKGYQDIVLMMGWAIISPFAGALEWRPTALLTADSQSGKSTIINRIIRPLASPKIYSGGGSTEPGIRQNVGIDTVPVVIEEFEADTPKKRDNRENILSLMRQSTSDDAPPAAKGTQDGLGMNFVLRSMFCFVGIDPTVSQWADENRMFRAELVEPKHTTKEWRELSLELKEVFSDEVCNGVRAFTWNNLSNIMKLYDRLSDFVYDTAAVRSIRTTKAHAILLATFLAVIENKPNATDEEISSFVKFFYSSSDDEQEPAHDENIELLDTILNYTIRDGSDNFSLRDLLSVIAGDLPVDADPALINMVSSRARRVAGDNGVGLTPEDENGKRHYAIAKSHKVIMKILDKGRGYDQLLYRHPDFMMKSKNVGLGSRTVNCVVIERVVE